MSGDRAADLGMIAREPVEPVGALQCAMPRFPRLGEVHRDLRSEGAAHCDVVERFYVRKYRREARLIGIRGVESVQPVFGIGPGESALRDHGPPVIGDADEIERLGYDEWLAAEQYTREAVCFGINLRPSTIGPAAGLGCCHVEMDGLKRADIHLSIGNPITSIR